MNLRFLLLATALLGPLTADPRAQDSERAAEEQYRFLAGLVERGLNEEAAREGALFLRRFPDHSRAPLARYRLAGALWELDRKADAAREYGRLVELEGFEYRAESLFRLGEAARSAGDTERARAAFAGVLEGRQSYLFAPARLALGDLEFAAGRFDEAEGHYLDLLREAADLPAEQAASDAAASARRALAWCAWERGEVEETIRRARRAREAESAPGRRDELTQLLGEALLEHGDARGALATFGELRTPGSEAARRRGQGHSLAALERFEDAAQAFEAVLAEHPDSPLAAEARLQAGIQRLRAGDSRGAARHLAQAARDGDPETAYWLARAQRADGQAQRALQTLERALEQDPASELTSRLLVLRGDCLSDLGRADDARLSYERSGSRPALHAAAVQALNQGDLREAVRLAESLQGPEAGPEARELLGEAYFRAERYADAEAVLGALAESGPEELRPRALSRLAWCRTLGGDAEGAIQRFRALVTRHPTAPESEEGLALLARLAAERGDLEGARRAAAQSVERHPDGPFLDQVLLVLARAEAAREDGAGAAIAGYRTLLERRPTSPLAPAARLELADLESRSGDGQAAARDYAELLRSAPDDPAAAQARYGLAWCQWEAGDNDACAATLEPLASDRSAPVELRRAALELLLWAQVRAGRLDDARGAWTALQSQGDDARTWEAARTLLVALREARRLDEAEALLESCRRRLDGGPLGPAVRVESAYLALEHGDPERAERLLTEVLRADHIEAQVAEAAFHVGEARLEGGQSERAAELFAHAGAVENPRTGDALRRLGRLWLERGDSARARGFLTTFLQRNPAGEGAAEVRFLLGEAWFREQRFEAAAEAFEAARVAAAGDDALSSRTLYRLGLALGHLQRWADCERTLSELARRHPDFPQLAEAELWRGRALAAGGKSRAARAALERVVALDGGDLAAAARLECGRLHEREGRLDEALSEYLKVALLYAHEESVCQALLGAGRVLQQQGQIEPARARWRELVERHPDSTEARSARERLEQTNPGGSRDGGG